MGGQIGSRKTSDALKWTQQCHAVLIWDLLTDAYEFVLNSHFQND